MSMHIHRFSFRKSTGVSLKYMVAHPEHPTERSLLLSAQFLHHELPVRLVQRVAKLKNLPYGLSTKVPVLQAGGQRHLHVSASQKLGVCSIATKFVDSSSLHSSGSALLLSGAVTVVAAAALSPGAGMTEEYYDNLDEVLDGAKGEEVEEAASRGMRGTNLIFTAIGCPFCRRAKQLLKGEGVQYTEHDLSLHPLLRRAVTNATGHKTVPVIFINGVFIGGYDELKKAVDSERLQKLLASPSAELPESIKEQMRSKPVVAGASDRRLLAADIASGSSEVLRYRRLEQVAERMAGEGGGLERVEVRDGWHTHRGVFSGAAAVEWMMKNLPDILDRTAAEELGREMQQKQLLHHVTFSEPFSSSISTFFRLHCHEPPLHGSSALNAISAYTCSARPAAQVAEELRVSVLALYDSSLSDDGRRVDYTNLASSREFQEFVSSTIELQRVDLFALSYSEKLAFWINIYNALVIHAIVARGGFPTSSAERKSFYRNSKYNLGGYDYSLDDIEHGVLRGNRPPPSLVNFLLPYGGRPFSPSDSRRFLAVTPLDARIHFALNCGARSCPAINVYSPGNVEEALDAAAAAFCRENVDVQSNGDRHTKVTLSKIFLWYARDFGGTKEDVLRWIAAHVDDDGQKSLLLEAAEGGSGAAVEYREYDWGMNEV